MAKIHIDLSQGIFDVEGEPDFVRDVYDDFKAELTKLSVQKPPLNDNPRLSYANGGAPVLIEENPAENSGSGRKKAKRTSQPPKGHSCSSRIMVLRKKEFFKAHKSPNDIVAGLAKEGWTHTNNQVSAALGQMFNRGTIQRTSAEKGFAYYWDRD